MGNLNRVEGDYIFYAWKDNEIEKYNKTIAELKLLGFKLKLTEHDYLNSYDRYENGKGDVKIVTTCMC